jgi:DnaK suppressor protein
MREGKNGLRTFKDLLNSKKEELRTRIEQRRMEIMVDGDPDDEGARAVDLASRDFAAFNMEREMRTLAEIESSLRRIAEGEYGLCTGCGADIPPARLEALPWTRLCVECAGGARPRSAPNPLRTSLLRRAQNGRPAGLGRR